ncbi:MAG: cation:proton antiporter [Candidatus Aenigmatarchaeota archaeon]
MEPLLDLALLLFGAKLGGILFSKLKQPSVIGELVAGIILGPSLLALVNPSDLVKVVSDLGLLFMILLVSLSIDWKILEGRAERFSWMELTRVILVIIAVYAIGTVLGWNIYTMVVMGTVIAIASTAIVARTLTDMKLFSTAEGQTLIGLEVIDEVVAIVSVAIIANVMGGSEITLWPIITTIFLVVGLFVVMSRVGFKFVTRVTSSIQKYGIDEALFAFTLLFAFLLGSITEGLNLASVLGVFIAGMILCRSAQHPIITRKVKEIGESFFIPVFFASVGLSINLFAASSQIIPILMIMGIIVGVKFVTAMAAFKLFRYSLSDALKLSSGFVTLSEMTAVIVAVAIAKLDPVFYVGLIASFVLINAVSPLLIKFAFGRRASANRRGWS